MTVSFRIGHIYLEQLLFLTVSHAEVVASNLFVSATVRIEAVNIAGIAHSFHQLNADQTISISFFEHILSERRKMTLAFELVIVPDHDTHSQLFNT